MSKTRKMLSLSAAVPDSNGNMITDKLEIKSGNLKLVCNAGSTERRTEVFVRVYKTSFEHYAVVYQNKKFCKASAYLNLKNCLVSVDHLTKQISVRPDDAEGTSVVLETDDYSLEAWEDAFSLSVTSLRGSISPKLSPVIPRSPVMQPLFESEGEEDDL